MDAIFRIMTLALTIQSTLTYWANAQTTNTGAIGTTTSVIQSGLKFLDAVYSNPSVQMMSETALSPYVPLNIENTTSVYANSFQSLVYLMNQKVPDIYTIDFVAPDTSITNVDVRYFTATPTVNLEGAITPLQQSTLDSVSPIPAAATSNVTAFVTGLNAINNNNMTQVAESIAVLAPGSALSTQMQYSMSQVNGTQWMHNFVIFYPEQGQQLLYQFTVSQNGSSSYTTPWTLYMGSNNSILSSSAMQDSIGSYNTSAASAPFSSNTTDVFFSNSTYAVQMQGGISYFPAITALSNISQYAYAIHFIPSNIALVNYVTCSMSINSNPTQVAQMMLTSSEFQTAMLLSPGDTLQYNFLFQATASSQTYWSNTFIFQTAPVDLISAQNAVLLSSYYHAAASTLVLQSSTSFAAASSSNSLSSPTQVIPNTYPQLTVAHSFEVPQTLPAVTINADPTSPYVQYGPSSMWQTATLSNTNARSMVPGSVQSDFMTYAQSANLLPQPAQLSSTSALPLNLLAGSLIGSDKSLSNSFGQGPSSFLQSAINDDLALPNNIANFLNPASLSLPVQPHLPVPNAADVESLGGSPTDAGPYSFYFVGNPGSLGVAGVPQVIMTYAINNDSARQLLMQPLPVSMISLGETPITSTVSAGAVNPAVLASRSSSFSAGTKSTIALPSQLMHSATVTLSPTDSMLYSFQYSPSGSLGASRARTSDVFSFTPTMLVNPNLTMSTPISSISISCPVISYGYAITSSPTGYRLLFIPYAPPDVNVTSVAVTASGSSDNAAGASVTTMQRSGNDFVSDLQSDDSFSFVYTVIVPFVDNTNYTFTCTTNTYQFNTSDSSTYTSSPSSNFFTAALSDLLGPSPFGTANPSTSLLYMTNTSQLTAVLSNSTMDANIMQTIEDQLTTASSSSPSSVVGTWTTLLSGLMAQVVLPETNSVSHFHSRILSKMSIDLPSIDSTLPNSPLWQVASTMPAAPTWVLTPKFTDVTTYTLPCMFAVPGINSMQSIGQCIGNEGGPTLLSGSMSLPKFSSTFGPVFQNLGVVFDAKTLLEPPTVVSLPGLKPEAFGFFSASNNIMPYVSSATASSAVGLNNIAGSLFAVPNVAVMPNVTNLPSQTSPEQLDGLNELTATVAHITSNPLAAVGAPLPSDYPSPYCSTCMATCIAAASPSSCIGSCMVTCSISGQQYGLLSSALSASTMKGAVMGTDTTVARSALQRNTILSPSVHPARSLSSFTSKSLLSGNLTSAELNGTLANLTSNLTSAQVSSAMSQLMTFMSSIMTADVFPLLTTVNPALSGEASVFESLLSSGMGLFSSFSSLSRHQSLASIRSKVSASSTSGAYGCSTVGLNDCLEKCVSGSEVNATCASVCSSAPCPIITSATNGAKVDGRQLINGLSLAGTLGKIMGLNTSTSSYVTPNITALFGSNLIGEMSLPTTIAALPDNCLSCLSNMSVTTAPQAAMLSFGTCATTCMSTGSITSDLMSAFDGFVSGMSALSRQTTGTSSGTHRSYTNSMQSQGMQRSSVLTSLSASMLPQQMVMQMFSSIGLVSISSLAGSLEPLAGNGLLGSAQQSYLPQPEGTGNFNPSQYLYQPQSQLDSLSFPISTCDAQAPTPSSLCTPQCMATVIDGDVTRLASCIGACATASCAANGLDQLQALRNVRILAAATGSGNSLPPAINQIPPLTLQSLFTYYPSLLTAPPSPLAQTSTLPFAVPPNGYMPYPFLNTNCVQCAEAAVNAAGTINDVQSAMANMCSTLNCFVPATPPTIGTIVA